MRGDLRIRGYTVGQRPNAPLWVAFAALIVAVIASRGSTVEEVARALFYVAFTIWAYEELANGINGFRRALGAVGLIVVVVFIAIAIG